MTPPLWLVAVLLTGAALVVAWPARSSRRRRRSLLATPQGIPGPMSSPGSTGSAGSPAFTGLSRWMGGLGWRGPGILGWRGPVSPAETGQPAGATGSDPVRRAPSAVDRSATGRGSLQWRASGRPRRAVLLVGLVGAGAGGVAAGPVAAALLAGYGMLGARAVHRRRAAGQVGQERRRQLDRLGALAADLRAGLPVPTLDRLDAPAGADGLTGTGRTATAPVPVTAGGSLDADCAPATDRGFGIGTRVRLPTASWSGDGLPSPSPEPEP